MEPRVCPSCGEANPARARLCGICSTPLVEDEAAKALRRWVTVVTSDLKGSTALGEKLDVESLREVVTRYFAVMTAVFEGHGGKIEKIIGDAIVAVYGLPFQHDDDPLRAVAAASESLRALDTLNEELEAGFGVRLVCRTGIATGYVEFGKESAGQRVLAGETMKVSTAMEQNSPPLGVLLADSTYQLVKDFVEVEAHEPASPKGGDEKYDCHVLVSVSGGDAHEDDVPPVASPGMRICPSCGEESPGKYVTCNFCGAALAARQVKETRRTVSIVFADPKPRTATGEPLAGEVTREVMPVYFDAMKAALEKHGGTVEKFIGDAVMAVFGLPVRHEDDALRAVRAAWDMQAALPALNARFAEYGVEFLNAIGVNTGEVIAGDALTGQRLVSGDTVNTAARLEQAAGPAEIILGPLTRKLAAEQIEVEAIPPLTLKGKAEPFPAFRLVSVQERPAERVQAATPFVGREVELGRLRDALLDAAGHKSAALMTVVGDGGVGKTRLLREFSTQAGRTAGVVRGRCLAYGDGVTYWPVREIVRNAAGIRDEDSREDAIAMIADLVRGSSDADTTREADAIAQRVAAAIGLSETPFPGTELFWAVRRLLESMASRRPLVVVVDDIHAAAPTFLELVDHVLEASRAAAILLVAVGRRELMENHPEWSESHADGRLELEPLSTTDTNELLERILSGLDAGVRGRIVEAGAGNPLYVEQIISMLLERGTIRRDGDAWVATAGADQISVPPTVEALVASRLDALAGEERQVIEPASVIGLSFPHEAIVELVEDGVRPELDAFLGTLTTKQLVRPSDGGAVYRFAHTVVRDTAYGGLLKRTRAALHEAFVAWAEPVNRERGREIEFEEILGYHLEQAYRYKTELGMVDDSARRVGARAAEKLSSAGLRAINRGDAGSGANLLRRAVAMLPDDSPIRLRLMPELAQALAQQGNFDDAKAALAEAGALAVEMDDQAAIAKVTLIGIQIGIYTGASAGTIDETAASIQAAIEVLARGGDEAGLALAYLTLGLLQGTAGRFEAASDALLEAVPHARRAGAVRRAASAAQGYASMALLSSTPVEDVLASCQRLLEDVAGDRTAEGVILGSVAVLKAMLGRFDDARADYRRGQETLRDLGPTLMSMSASTESSRVEMLADDPIAAERELRRDYAALEALGEKYFRSTIAGHLAESLYAQGRFDEAFAMSELTEQLADPDDSAVQILWRTARARVVAREGRADEAIAMVEDAARMAHESGSPTVEGAVLIDQAEVLELLGRRESAGPPLREALRLFELKGDVVSAARVRRRLTELGDLTPA